MLWGHVIVLIQKVKERHCNALPHLLPLERAIFKANGVQHYIQIHGYMVDALNLNQKELNLKIVSIIKKIAAAKGNVLIHCDTGVIFGILNKCYNKQTLKNIRQNTLCHIGNTSHYQKRTFKRAMSIIQQFPCDLLEK